MKARALLLIRFQPLCRESFALNIPLTPPAPARIENSTRFFAVDEHLQRREDDAELLGTVARLTEWVTERPAQVNGARWTHLLGNITQADDTDRRNAGSFNRACYQSNGLITDSSSGGE